MHSTYILLQAYSDSDWDPVSFALVPINLKDINNLIARINLLENLRKQDDDLFFIGGYSMDCDFFSDSSELPDEKVLQNPTLIQFDEYQIEKFSRPEATVESGEFKVSSGSVQFRGSAKHSSDHFWTDDVTLDNLELFRKIFLTLKSPADRKKFQSLVKMTSASDTETRNLLQTLLENIV